MNFWMNCSRVFETVTQQNLFAENIKKLNVINFGRSAFEHLTNSLPKIISLTWRKITSTFHKRL